MQNIEEILAAITFPEPEAAKVEEPVAVAEVEVAAIETEPATAEELAGMKKQAEGKKEAKKVVEEELAKDGVALDELFKMKPEIFQTAGPADDAADKKKDKKGKKKAVELEFDEGLGAVVGRKIHKRGDTTPDNDWE
jgi:hypothetical protein